MEADDKQANKVICVSGNLALINDRETKYGDIKAAVRDWLGRSLGGGNVGAEP